jgi:hypothetical protein
VPHLSGQHELGLDLRRHVGSGIRIEAMT